MQFMFLNMMVHTETGWICVGYVFQSCQIKVPITMYTRRANVAMEHHVLAVCVCVYLVERFVAIVIHDDIKILIRMNSGRRAQCYNTIM